MSGSEKKESELGPRAELERIQMLQKRVSEKQPQPQPQLTGSNSYASIMKQCESILNKLTTHQFGWVFNYPVDAVALQIPDYYTVIKHPMDLSTIKNKLSSGAYSSPLDFVADVRLTFTNAMTYNPPGNEVHIMADKLSKFFELEWISVEKKLAVADTCVKRDTESAEPVLQPKKRKAYTIICNIAPEKVTRRVTAEARQCLSNRLQYMPEDTPDQIVDFLRRHSSRTNEPGQEEIEVDIDVLSDDVLLELRKLVDDCLPEKQIGHHAKAEPSEIEILSEYGPSNSSMHPRKGFCIGNKPVNEDVDICGNDPPMSSDPSVEIERDATHGGSKCSSSSSSGSDSDSSSSDSDSGSSSGSDSQDTGASAKTAKMSGSERKESELGPIAELERIQMLQKRGTEKQPQPQPQTQLTGSKFYASIMKQCESILNKLRTHQFGWVFNYPVDAVALKIPDYYTVIKHPMDLSTIKDKLSSGAYSSPLDFVADVRLTFTNAMTYNPPGNEVHIMADKLSKFFELEWISVEKKLAAADMCVKRDTQAAKPVLQPKKRKASPVICNIAPEKVIRRVTAEARHRLGNRLQSMPEDLPDQIIDFLRRHNSRTNESGEEEIKVDIDVLSDDVLLELRKLMDDCLPEKQIGHQAKAEPSEIEILSEYGPSNSSMHPCKGNEHVTEDVDICGNDPSMSSYPSVELERDATHGGSKCSCSSSSGVDSDSSSSDSDSGTQDTGATPAKTAKDNKRLDTVQDQDKSYTMNPLDVKQNC